MTAAELYTHLLMGFELDETLRSELELEQDYLDHVIAVVREAGASEQIDEYSSPSSFSGGRDAPEVVLIAALLEAQGSSDGAGTVHCGLWPSGQLGARTRRQRGMSAILFDMGLWFYLRYACQQVSCALATITGQERPWGPDHPGSEPGRELGHHLDLYTRNQVSLRDDTRLRVLAGPREQFRRDLNAAAVAYVVGHELAHATSTDAELKTIAWSESTELASQQLENDADQHSVASLLRHRFADAPLATVLGPILVLYLQGFALRTQQAEGMDPVNWTHLAPEIRAVVVKELLTRDQNPALAAVANRFVRWLTSSWDYDNLFHRASERST